MSEKRKIDYSSKDEVFIVEVLDRRVKKGLLDYLVLIKCGPGYIQEWFPKESLDCGELIIQYETKRQALIGARIREREKLEDEKLQ